MSTPLDKIHLEAQERLLLHLDNFIANTTLSDLDQYIDFDNKSNTIKIIGDIEDLKTCLYHIHIVSSVLSVNSRESLFDNLILVQDRCKKLYQEKNNAYGNAYRKYGVLGVIIRIQDKISRYNRLNNSEIKLFESIEDTLIDLSNYSAMALMLLNEVL